jgi:hypothetical protein
MKATMTGQQASAIFMTLVSEHKYASALALCKKMRDEAPDDADCAFWAGQTATLYSNIGSGVIANTHASAGLQYAKQAGSAPRMAHCAGMLTMLPKSEREFKEMTSLLQKIASGDMLYQRAEMFLQGMQSGIPLYQSMLQAAASTEQMGFVGLGQACSILDVLYTYRDNFKISEDECREILLTYSSNISSLVEKIRMELMASKKNMAEEYLIIMHPAIKQLQGYAARSGYDTEAVMEYERLSMSYSLIGDRTNTGSSIFSFDSLNSAIRKCSRCGMPVFGRGKCLACDFQN